MQKYPLSGNYTRPFAFANFYFKSPNNGVGVWGYIALPKSSKLGIIPELYTKCPNQNIHLYEIWRKVVCTEDVSHGFITLSIL